MQRNLSTNALYSAAFAASVLTLSAVAQAAPLAYETQVKNNNPYLFYRFQETQSPLTNVLANDSSANNRDNGPYRGTPTGGIAGNGADSDTAVSFPGPSPTASSLHYLKTTDSRSFGSEVEQSSYEFVFKSNTSGYTASVGLFSVFNAADSATGRTGNGAVAVELNFKGGGTGTPGFTRLYFRDEGGRQLFGDFAHGSLLDGEYHHLVLTADMSAVNVSDKIKAYVDGFSLPVTIAQSSAGAPTDFREFTVDPTFAARNERGNVRLPANITIDEASLYTSTLSQSQVEANATAAGFIVPEPGSLALAGIAGLGLLARRRRHA